MEKITLKHIHKKNNTISFDYSVSAGLAGYFSGKTFVVEYQENIEGVPDAIAAVPFVCSILPIIWLNNSTLEIKELDKAFYDCIPNVRKGYETMFPESSFLGNIEVANIVPCDIPSCGGSVAFFSGGLDAVNTLINHLPEKPVLMSVWGSDIRYDNAEGWNKVHCGIAEYSETYSLPDIVIRSAFRDFDNEGVLDRKFCEQLQDSWWHGVKHALGLLGHAAPYVYLHGVSTVYIASTNCPADGPVRCASNPLTDNHVRFANARVVHDGFEFSRQGKVRNVAEYVRRTGSRLPLHVCWESQTGSNCCHCEKCYRTMVGLIAEGEDPLDYGFEHTPRTMPDLQRYLVTNCRNMVALQDYWTHIQKRLAEHRVELRNHMYWKNVKWILKVDFWHPETWKRSMNLRERLSQYKFYQKLHEIKVKLRG